MNKILLLGKNGQLGSEFIKILKANNVSYDAFSHNQLDILDTFNLKKIVLTLKPNIIINTTAFHVTYECELKPLDAFSVNCIAVFNLAKIAKEIEAKYITFSTNYVFDGIKKLPYNEFDNPSPVQMYGLSKLAGEIAAINEYPIGTYIIRTCSVFGGKRGSKSKKGNYVIKILNEALKNKIVYASKKQIVNPTYAGHLAKSSLDLLNSKAEPGIYHLANEGEISWFDFAKKILANKNLKNVDLIEFKNNEENIRFRSPEYSVLSNTKAKKFGVILPSVDDGLSEYLHQI